MKPINRPGVHKTGLQMLGNKLFSMTPLFYLLKLLISLYQAIVDFVHWAKLMRSSTRPLNELTLEGLYMKELEVFYFDFFDYKDWERTKTTIRCLMTGLVLSTIFYLLATYLMDLDLQVRVVTTCVVSTLLTLLLSYSPVSRAITFLFIPSMAQGSLRNALLTGALVLLAAGPGYNLRSNMDAISSSKACLHEQFFDIVSLVKSLHGKNVVTILMIPIRMIIIGMQMVAELIYRGLHTAYMALRKLMLAMKRFFKKIGKVLGNLGPSFSFSGNCQSLVRRLSRAYRRTRLLGGFIQFMISIVNAFRSNTNSPPIAKPTIGYFVHEIGTSVCDLLRKVKKIIKEKKRRLKEWFQRTVMKAINKIRAVFSLISDATGPNTKVTIRMIGGIRHEMDAVKKNMHAAVGSKTVSRSRACK